MLLTDLRMSKISTFPARESYQVDAAISQRTEFVAQRIFATGDKEIAEQTHEMAPNA